MAKNILILADFIEGTWDAICFTMRYLRNGGTTINLLQTYQKPDVGHSVHRDIIPILEKISIDELEELRSKILSQFEIPKRKIKLLSIEGNLRYLLSNHLKLNDVGGVVVGLYDSIPETGFLIQRKISNIIKWSSHPLFFLPGRFSDSEIHKIVFITDPYSKPSLEVLDKLKYLSSKARSEIHILFTAQNDTQDNQDDIKSNIFKHLSGITVTTDYLRNASMDLIRNYLNLTSCDLVVIEKNNYQRFKSFFAIHPKSSSNCTNGMPVLLIVP